MAFVFWWLMMIWQPALMCAQTNGAYRPSEAQAVAICDALRAVQAPSTGTVVPM